MTKLNDLYNAHEEAQELFDSTRNPRAKDMLAQSLTCSTALLTLYEAGDNEERAELEADMEKAVTMTRNKIRLALEVLDECPDTLRAT